MKSLLVLALLASALAATAQEPRLWFAFLTKGDAQRPAQEELQRMQMAHLDNFGKRFGEGKLLMAGPLRDEEFRLSALETIEAIKEVRIRHPLVNSILGVSNVSFGLKPAARQILNSTFLHYALEAGLTSAIVHFSKIKPENQIEPEIWKVATDLVYDKREFAMT